MEYQAGRRLLRVFDDLELILDRLHAVGIARNLHGLPLLGGRRHITLQHHDAISRIDVDLQATDIRVREHLGLDRRGDRRVANEIGVVIGVLSITICHARRLPE